MRRAFLAGLRGRGGLEPALAAPHRDRLPDVQPLREPGDARGDPPGGEDAEGGRVARGGHAHRRAPVPRARGPLSRGGGHRGPRRVRGRARPLAHRRGLRADRGLRRVQPKASGRLAAGRGRPSLPPMELSYVLDPRRWQARFKSEADVRAETIAAGQAPDATVDEVGSAPAPEGFEGTALPGHTRSGYGTAIPAVRGGPAGARRRRPAGR